MEAIEKNKFYVALGAAVLVCFFICYFSRSSQQKNLARAQAGLKNIKTTAKKLAEGKLPNMKIVEYHEKRKAELTQKEKEVIDFLSKSDAEIEKWFESIGYSYIFNLSSKYQADLEKSQISEDLKQEFVRHQIAFPAEPEKIEIKKNPKGWSITEKETQKVYVIQKDDDTVQNEFKVYQKTSNPALQRFRAVYTTEKRNLIGKYLDRKGGLKIGEGEEIDPRLIEKILDLPPDRDIDEGKMKNIQKLFWLKSGILELIEEGKLLNLTKYNFSEPVKRGIFQHYSVDMEGTIEYAKASLLLQKLLTSKKFMIEVKSIEIRRKDWEPKESEKIKVPWDKSENEALEEWKKTNESKFTLPPVVVVINFHIFDYEN